MTSHPSPYALIHFTFIRRTSNDFPPMKGIKEEAETLVGEKWNLLPAMAIGRAPIKRCEGGYIAITEVTQDGDNNHFRLLMYAHCFAQLAFKQTDTCLNLHARARRRMARALTQWPTGPDGSVHCDMLGSLYTD